MYCHLKEELKKGTHPALATMGLKTMPSGMINIAFKQVESEVLGKNSLATEQEVYEELEKRINAGTLFNPTSP